MGEWAAYEREYGPILIHERIDVGAALIAMHLVGDPKRTLQDFLPNWTGRNESEESLVKRLIAFKESYKNREDDA